MKKEINHIVKKIKHKLISKGVIKVRKNKNPIKWGIIGLGYMGNKFSCAIDGSSCSIVYCAASRSIKKAQKFSNNHNNCIYYGSYTEMIEKESKNIDVVYVATPVESHRKIIKFCLDKKLNVLCEKPIVKRTIELTNLINLSKKNNCFLMEGMWMRLLPTFALAKSWIDKGLIGDIKLIKVDFNKMITNNRLDILDDYGVYSLSFISCFFEKIPKNIELVYKKNNERITTDLHILIRSNKKNAIINISSNFSSKSYASVLGSNGSIEWDSQFNRTNKIKLYDRKNNLVKSKSFQYSYDGFEFQISEVSKNLIEGNLQSDIVSHSESLKVIKLLELIKSKTKKNVL